MSAAADTLAPEKRARVAFLSTGTVRIRQSMRSQPANGYAIARQLRSLRDQRWTGPLPIGVFIIRHPEGVFLYDTGQSPCCNDASYFPRAGFLGKWLARYEVQKEDGIIALLKQQGINPGDLRGVILSHLHSDHAGGLEDLIAAEPDLPIYISREHWNAFGKHPVFASFSGAAPNHWPKDFCPTIIDLHERPVGPWKKSFALTSDEKIIVVDTSGHVLGHLSVVTYGESEEKLATTYFLTGDATYGIEQLDIEEPDGINDDPMRALQSLKNIKEFARQGEVVVLPSHDPKTSRLLSDRVVYHPKG